MPVGGTPAVAVEPCAHLRDRSFVRRGWWLHRNAQARGGSRDRVGEPAQRWNSASPRTQASYSAAAFTSARGMMPSGSLLSQAGGLWERRKVAIRRKPGLWEHRTRGCMRATVQPIPRQLVGLVTRCRSRLAHAQSLRRNLHGADIFVGVLDSRDAAATNQQVFLEDCPVRWIEPIHNERFGYLAQIGRAMVAVGEHGLMLCRSGPNINRTGSAAGPVPACRPIA